MNHLFLEPLCVHKKAWNTCGECRPTLANTPMQNNTQESWEEEFEEEFVVDTVFIGVRKIAEQRPDKIVAFIHALLSKQAEEISEAVEGLKRNGVAKLDSEKDIVARDNFFYNLAISDTLLAIKQVTKRYEN